MAMAAGGNKPLEPAQQRRPRTFATIAPPGTFLGEIAAGGTGVVVGRAVANTEFMRALIRALEAGRATLAEPVAGAR